MAFVELPQNVIVYLCNLAFHTSADLGLAVNKLFY